MVILEDVTQRVIGLGAKYREVFLLFSIILNNKVALQMYKLVQNYPVSSSCL